MDLTYAELFAGAGGLSRGLEAAGFHCVAHAEIEPHARAVLRKQWPGVRLDGDVTQLNGADYAGITLLSGGSPCQDLSVAGKRKGLAGERSGLFHEQVRIWNESGAPYFLWENVLGALSSNAGQDFAVVLSTLVGAPITVPADGWRRAGVAAGATGVAAWRVSDLQHFGPPQRRVRVFVFAARAGGVDPAEVLALSEGVCGHPSPRSQAREGVTGSAAAGTRSSCLTPWDAESKRVFTQDAVFPTLYAAANSGQQQQSVMAFESTGGSWGVNEGDTSPPIKIGTGLGIASPPAVVAFSADVLPTMVKNGDANSAFRDAEGIVVCTTGHVTHALTHVGADASEDGTGRGTPIVAYSRGGYGDWTENEAVTALCARDHKYQSSIVLPALPASLENSGTGHNKDELIIAQHGQYNATFDSEVAPTLTCLHEQPYLVKKEWPKPIADTLTVAYAEKWGLEDQHINSGAGLFQPTATGRPRRLTPLECERLMSWPDQWTARGVREDGTEYELSDTARYRLCGNGVGSVQVQWIAERLARLLTAP